MADHLARAQAQVNVAQRLLSDPPPPGVPAVGPEVLFRYQRQLEPPELAEGFAAVEEVPFVRRHPAGHTRRGLVCWLEGVLRGRSAAGAPTRPQDVAVLPGRAAVLARYRAAGYLLAGITWHPEVAAGAASEEEVAATLARTAELLGGGIDLRYCPHAGGPPRCWCRSRYRGSEWR